MVSACIIFLQTSCVVPQPILLYRGGDNVLLVRIFPLEDLVRSSTAQLCSGSSLECHFFPTLVPVTKENMNYVSVFVTGLVALVVGLWFTSKKGRFTEPKIDIAQLKEWRMAAINGGIVGGDQG
ncbi:hypothetical protein BDZ45DRAFT_751937 [Acephala macrosclerotiorum]|nr:hypothetical protein BDZ45DRAFT_751937 [Acephala macrosclerotiorum]